MRWVLEYWTGALPLDRVTSDEAEWDTLSLDSVQRVSVSEGIYTLVLQGLDSYWIDGNRFGCFVDPDNEHVYDGIMSSVYEIAGGEIYHLGEGYPPVGVNILGSTYMPDDAAREVGIL